MSGGTDSESWDLCAGAVAGDISLESVPLKHGEDLRAEAVDGRGYVGLEILRATLSSLMAPSFSFSLTTPTPPVL